MTEKQAVKLNITFNRHGRMDDAEFYAALAVDEANPLYRAVLELLDRAEDQMWDINTDLSLDRDRRADIGLAAGAIREIRAQLEAAREIGRQNQQQN